MRFDVDHAIAEHERKRAARVATPVLSDLELERFLLAAIISDVGVLERCGELEVEDFFDHRHKFVFAAVRNLEARGEPVGPCEVADEIERTDALLDKHVSDSAGIFFVAELVLSTWTFGGCEHALAGACRRLRVLAQRRQTA